MALNTFSENTWTIIYATLILSGDSLFFLNIYHFRRELSMGNSSESKVSKLEKLKNI